MRIHLLPHIDQIAREGMMFIQDGHFDAETHVLGDDHSSSVTFVGEFQLR